MQKKIRNAHSQVCLRRVLRTFDAKIVKMSKGTQPQPRPQPKMRRPYEKECVYRLCLLLLRNFYIYLVVSIFPFVSQGIVCTRLLPYKSLGVINFPRIPPLRRLVGTSSPPSAAVTLLAESFSAGSLGASFDFSCPDM